MNKHSDLINPKAKLIFQLGTFFSRLKMQIAWEFNFVDFVQQQFPIFPGEIQS